MQRDGYALCRVIRDGLTESQYYSSKCRCYGMSERNSTERSPKLQAGKHVFSSGTWELWKDCPGCLMSRTDEPEEPEFK